MSNSQSTNSQTQAFDLGGDRASGISPGEQASPRERGISASALEQLRLAWLRAVALAWAEPAKLDLLKRDPARFLEIHCGYELPEGLDLVVREEQAGPSSPEDAPRSPGVRDMDGGARQAQLTMRVPPPPKLEDQAIAMADLARGDIGHVLVSGCIPC
ncbi:hypothetical protein WMF31_16210 [Sorangium sp. So ce1036]|uniref:BMA_0021/BMA_0022 family TOMM bacteriocin n=1 Tax=Sorangium sp. So ce1036 TaxID=3133328 RepID=UPI003F11CB18